MPQTKTKRTRKRAETAAKDAVPVVALCGRARSGEHRPWLVEGDDGNFYYFKHTADSCDRLATGYLFSRLAEECGLPAAAARILDLPGTLLRHSALDGAGGLPVGLGYGSMRVSFAEDLRSTHLAAIPDETKQRCLCFDWWTRNPGRRLDRLGGDPNAVWDPMLQQVFLVGHGRCLDPSFDPADFLRRHPFRDARPFLERGFVEKWRTRFESAIYRLDEIWAEMPDEWQAGDGRGTALSFSAQDIAARLMKPELAPEGILPQ